MLHTGTTFHYTIHTLHALNALIIQGVPEVTAQTYGGEYLRKNKKSSCKEIPKLP